MTPKEMEMLKLTGRRPRSLANSPLSKEIEATRKEIIRGVLNNAHKIINKQLELADLPVSSQSKDNDTVLKATNSLLDRTFGKPKESIDFTGNVEFSLKALAKSRDVLEIPNTSVEDALNEM